ncbi:hypothetical protein G7046_g8602 [Stylonectria norvegica]|nr:hypothetical protein G7046_g8602 [Stylonectria norvegica]
MQNRDGARSSTSISLHELDSSSRSVNSRRKSSDGDCSDRPRVSHTQAQDRDQDQEEHSQDQGVESPEPRGAGTAVPPAEGTVDATAETTSTWPWSKALLSRFWGSHVSCEVELEACRDHLALERTFLGYLRTSMQMSMFGTVVAQLFSLKNHDSGFGYTLVGKPLAAVCFIFSIGTLLLGAVRSWRHQRAIIRGKALVSGLEIHIIGIAVAMLLVVFFGLLVAIDVVKVASPEATLATV